MAGGGSPTDWWSSQDSGQLGPEWLSSMLAAVTVPATTSVGNHGNVGEAHVVVVEAIPVRGGPARRRGGHGGSVAAHLGRRRRFLLLPLQALASKLCKSPFFGCSLIH
ncbi:unnamed protein product [Urochloa humidicola]